MFLIPFRNQRTIGLGCSHYSRCFNVSMLLDTKHTSICIFHPHNYHLVPSYLMCMSFFSAWPHHSISDPITLAYILRRHSLISFFFSFVFSFHSCFISLSSIHPLIMSIHVHSFIHSITSSFVCPFIRSSFLSFIRSFIRLISFICSFVHSFLHSSIRSIRSFVLVHVNIWNQTKLKVLTFFLMKHYIVRQKKL